MDSPIKKIITEYIYRSLNIEGLPYPQNVSLENYNIWQIATDFEQKTKVRLSDRQLKSCKTVGQFVSMCYSAVILSSKAKIENLENETSNQRTTSNQRSASKSSNERNGWAYSNEPKTSSNTTQFSSGMSDMSVESLFQMVRKPLRTTLADIQRLKTGERKFDSVRSSFLDSLTNIISEAEQQEDYLKRNLVQDHLVIAFFGTTNAGKSTIIDTFRIIFDEETRRQAMALASKTFAIGVDGTIVGDGRSDFTKTYDEYNMTIDGKKFTLIDVPGIEGNEAEYKTGIKKALQKAHCVFYVHGSDAKPNTKTTEKIKEYLNDWVSVYSIRNIRGGSEQYDEDEERETLLTDSVLRASRLSEDVFMETLGKHYKGNINVQGLLALCAKAKFSPQRTDLKGIQSELLENFGNSDAIFSFSCFQNVIDEVRRMSVGYKELIYQSNKDKVKALARRAIHDVNNCISQQKESIDELDKKLNAFERNVSSSCTKAEQRLNVKALVEKEFDVMRYALYRAIDTDEALIFTTICTDTKKEDFVKCVAKQQCEELENRLIPQIEKLCADTTQWYSDELKRLKRDLDSSVKIGNLNISVKVSVDVDVSKITNEMKNFDFGKAISTAMAVAGIALFPGVGWILGGAIELISAIFGGLFGNDDGRAEAKQKVDSTIDDVCEKTIMQLNDGALKSFKNQYKTVEKNIKQKIRIERDNILNLKHDIENLKEEIISTINIIK